jgi:EmrB/QacA subfamily drug resistance transporter
VAGPAKSWLAPLLVLMVGSFLPPMDSSIVNVAISFIQKDLGGGADDIAWVSTAYSLGLAVFVPTSNWLANRLGLTLLHRIAMVGFLAGTTLCGLAWDLNSLIVFRVLEALPGSILPVITITMIYQIVPKDRIGAAMGIYGLGVVVAPGLGPTIGGLLVEDLSWRWVFYFKVPLGALAVIAGLFVLPKMARGETARKFDWCGFLTLGYGLAALVVVSSKGQKWHWDSYLVMILVVSALLSLALFAVIENEVESPLLDLRVLKSWPFVNSLLMIGVLTIGLFAMSFYLPEFLENVQGFTARNTGLLLLPQSLVGVLLVPLVGRLYDRFGARWLAFLGLILVALATYLLCGINVDMTRQQVIIWTVIRGFGLGLAFMPIMTNGLSWLPPHLVGYGGAMNNIMQRMSAALGVAAMGTLISHETAQLTSDMGALQTGASKPPFQNADTQTLLGLYQQFQAHVHAIADADMFTVTTAATLACALLALMLKKAPRRPAPTPTPKRPNDPPAREPDRLAAATGGHVGGKRNQCPATTHVPATNERENERQMNHTQPHPPRRIPRRPLNPPAARVMRWRPRLKLRMVRLISTTNQSPCLMAHQPS